MTDFRERAGLAFVILVLISVANALQTTKQPKTFNNEHLSQFEESSRHQAKREIWPVAGALLSVMSPLSALALDEDKIPSTEDMHEIFRNSMENFENIQDVFQIASLNEKIAAAVATAFAPSSSLYYTQPPTGVWNHPASTTGAHVASNAEMAAMFHEMIDKLTNGLQVAFEKLDSLTVEQKIAAAVATYVLSFPIAYEWYKHEGREEERLAEQRRAILKAKKAALAKKKAAEFMKKGVKGEKAKTEKGSKVPKEIPSEAPEKFIAQESEAPTDIPEKVPAEVTVDTETIKPKVFVLPVDVLKKLEPATTQPAGVHSPSSSEEDGGLAAYAAAYAALLAETKSVAVPGDNGMAETKKEFVAARAAGGSGIPSYLDSLSRGP